MTDTEMKKIITKQTS